MPKNEKALKITYLKSSNGKLIEDQDPIIVFASENQTVISTKDIIDGKSIFPFEKSFVDRKSINYIQSAKLSSNNEIFTSDSLSIESKTLNS